jgi:hypothetical protein
MRAGLLRDSLIVERLGAESEDAYGNPTPADWETQITAQNASIMPMGGDEAMRADRLTGIIKFEVMLRWSSANAAILATDRFVLARDGASLASGTALNVRHAGVDPTGKKRELRFIVESGEAT